MQKFGREVGLVRPNQRMQFRVQSKTLESLDISQWFEDRPVDPILEINVALRGRL